MDYEKKYKETLERAKQLLRTSVAFDRFTIERVFPELKENKKEWIEKIRQELKFYLKHREVKQISESDAIQQWIAWLEKQGDKPQGKSALEAIKEEKVDNQNCVKSADKVNPKFKVGDWVVFDNGNVEHITSVGTHGYTFDDGDYLLHDECDKIAHLWSIQDAKDGDVLCVKYGNDEMPFIFTGKQHDVAYCALNSFGEFVLSMAEWLLKVSVLPATKEQRDTLFAKMKEAGYTFDFEKKELKKVEQEQDSINPSEYINDIGGNGCYLKNTAQVSSWSKKDEKMFEYALNMIEWYSGKNEDKSRYVSDWLKSLKQRIGG